MGAAAAAAPARTPFTTTNTVLSNAQGHGGRDGQDIKPAMSSPSMLAIATDALVAIATTD